MVLQNYYPILFRGVNGTVAHEFIVDLRGFKVCLSHTYHRWFSIGMLLILIIIEIWITAGDCWYRAWRCCQTSNGLRIPWTNNVLASARDTHDWTHGKRKQGIVLPFPEVSPADHLKHVWFPFQAELDRFCDALISIREEIAQIESGKADINNNVLKVWGFKFSSLHF